MNARLLQWAIPQLEKLLNWEYLRVFVRERIIRRTRHFVAATFSSKRTCAIVLYSELYISDNPLTKSTQPKIAKKKPGTTKRTCIYHALTKSRTGSYEDRILLLPFDIVFAVRVVSTRRKCVTRDESSVISRTNVCATLRTLPALFSAR
jgi:hypothetical protein